MSSTAKIFKMIDALTYNGKGTENQSAFPDEFVNICKMTQNALKSYLSEKLSEYYETVIENDGYIYAPGSSPVALTAHMDTVHKYPVVQYWGNVNDKGQHIISSSEGIGGDDRCGVFMILEILRTTVFRPTIIFCEDEEIGGVGSEKFIKDNIELNDVRFFIELDRANGNDLVFYEDDNEDFQTWCEDITGYVTNFGSFSDISNFCPVYGISGVNISCGYYNPHTVNEYVVLEEMEASIMAAIKLIDAASELEEPFEYIEYTYAHYRDGRYMGWNDIYDYDSVRSNKNKFMTEVVFYYNNSYLEEVNEVVSSESVLGAIGMFMTEHPDLRWADVLDYEIL